MSRFSNGSCTPGMTYSKLRGIAVSAIYMALVSCGNDTVAPDPDPIDDPDLPSDVVTIPVVVHVVHFGEAVGKGTNLSDERIQAQIRILNEDFRRTPGSPGFNTHPDGNDSRIQFALAQVGPAGAATTGVNRIDATAAPNPVPTNQLFDHYAHHAYWDPERYVNIWTMPLPAEARDVVLGMATGPDTNLPGGEFLLPGEPDQAEGILINADHFGPTGMASEHGFGRTLTHEMGHYLGLLHLWGSGDCATNDFCADTPPVSEPVFGCSPVIGCDGRPVMVQNYMTYSSDACMNVFTNEQITRMRYVLDRSPRRRELATSSALEGR